MPIPRRSSQQTISKKRSTAALASPRPTVPSPQQLADASLVADGINLTPLLCLARTSVRTVTGNAEVVKEEDRDGESQWPQYQGLLSAEINLHSPVRSHGPALRAFKCAFDARLRERHVTRFVDLSKADKVAVVFSLFLFRLYIFRCTDFVGIYDLPSGYEAAIKPTIARNLALLSALNSLRVSHSTKTGRKPFVSDGLYMSQPMKDAIIALKMWKAAGRLTAREEAEVKRMDEWKDVKLPKVYGGSADALKHYGYRPCFVRAAEIVEEFWGEVDDASSPSAEAMSQALLKARPAVKEMESTVIRERLQAGLEASSHAFGGFGRQCLRHRLLLGDMLMLGIIDSFPAELMGCMLALGSRRGLQELASDWDVSGEEGGELGEEDDDDKNAKQPISREEQQRFIKIHKVLLEASQDLSISYATRRLILDAELHTVPGLEHSLCKLMKARRVLLLARTGGS